MQPSVIDKIWLKIFIHNGLPIELLLTVGCVCRSWHTMADSLIPLLMSFGPQRGGELGFKSSAIMYKCTNLTRLTIGDCLGVTENALEAMANLTELHLDIGADEGNITNKSLSTLTNITNLKITYPRIHVTDSSVQQLTNLTSLTVCRLRRFNFERIAELPHLVHLNATEIKMNELLRFTNLTKLELRNTKPLTGRVLSQLTNITELTISHCLTITGHIFLPLLTSLTLDSCGLWDYQSFKRLSSLTILHLWNTKLTPIVQDVLAVRKVRICIYYPHPDIS